MSNTTQDLDEVANRNAVWAFEVDGDFIRWCGNLEQFKKDCADYVSASAGKWTCHSKFHYSFDDETTGIVSHFKASKR